MAHRHALLCTDLLVYEGDSCVVRGRHSAFRGSTSCRSTDLPAAALPRLGAARRRALFLRAPAG